MASRLGGRIFAQAVRPTLRATARTAGRRSMSSSGHATKSSDMPWIIGSAVVFGPATIWLLLPQSDKKPHDVAFGQANLGAHTLGEVKKDNDHSESEEASAEPKDGESTEDKQAEDGSMTDSEGETVSGKEVKESMQQGFDEDLPPDAQAAEEKKGKDDKWAEGAPGQNSEAEAKPDQKEKPSQKKGGEAPSNMGDARKTSTGGEAPKESGASK